MALSIHLIRHGAVAGPAALYGSTDVPVSAAGSALVVNALTRLHQQSPLSAIVSSPKQRCRVPAAAFCGEEAVLLTVEEDLRELHFGDWDGVPFDHWDTLFASRPHESWPQLEAFYANPHQTQAPNGETLKDFTKRVHASINRSITHALTQEHEQIAIVCHGGVIRAIIAQVLDTPLTGKLFSHLKIDYASTTTLVYTPSQRLSGNPSDPLTDCHILRIGQPPPY